MKLFFTSVMALAATAVSAQFNVRSTTPTSSQKPAYDSSVNFSYLKCAFNPQSLVGQELYFAPIRAEATYNQDNFELPLFISNRPSPVNSALTDMIREQVTMNDGALELKDPTAQKTITSFSLSSNLQTYVYQPQAVEANFVISLRTSLAGISNKFYKIIACTDTLVTEEGCWYKIDMQDPAGATVSWNIHTRQLSRKVLDHVHLKGYVEKLKSTYLNQKLYLQENLSGRQEFYNPLDKQNYPCKADDKYTCTDVTFVQDEGLFPDLMLIVKNADNIEKGIRVEYNEDDNSLSMSSFLTEKNYLAMKQKEKNTNDSLTAIRKTEDARYAANNKARKASLIKKYGQTNGTLISNGQVKLGMNTDMCEDSWGTPSRVSRSSSSAGVVLLWFYPHNNWLKFVNGKLIQIFE